MRDVSFVATGPSRVVRGIRLALPARSGFVTGFFLPRYRSARSCAMLSRLDIALAKFRFASKAALRASPYNFKYKCPATLRFRRERLQRHQLSLPETVGSEDISERYQPWSSTEFHLVACVPPLVPLLAVVVVVSVVVFAGTECTKRSFCFPNR